MNLADPIFHNAAKARAHLEATRWPHGPICPHCGVVNEATYVGGKAARVGCYQCNACREQFTVTVGTVFERSKVPLNKWLLASYMIAASKKGVSALQISRQLGVTYKTAWFMCHRLREAMAPADGAPPLGGEGKVIEADASYVGGKEKNKHKSKRKAGNIGGKGKAIIHTLVERQGGARSHVVTDVTGATLRPIIVKNASRKSAFMTDTHGGYHHVGKEFASHGMVDHGKDEYVRYDGPIPTHSNTAEGCFAIFKRGVYGTFHSLSEAHLHRYLAEFDFRYSNRSALGINDTMRADELLRGIAGKRLTYRRTGEAAYA